MAMPILPSLVGSDAAAMPEDAAPPTEDATSEVLTIDDLTPDELAALEAEAMAALDSGALDGIEIPEAAGAAEPPDAAAEPAQEGADAEGGDEGEGGTEEAGEGAPMSTTQYAEEAMAMADALGDAVKEIEDAAKDLDDPKLADPVIDQAWEIADEAEKVAKDAKKAIKKDDIDTAYAAYEAVELAKSSIADLLEQVKTGAVAVTAAEPDPEADPLATWASVASKPGKAAGCLKK